MMLDTYVSLPWQKNQAYSTAAAPIFRPPTDTFSLEAWAVVCQAKYKYVSSIMWLGLHLAVIPEAWYAAHRM